MAKNNIDTVKSSFYDPHLRGTRGQKNNPAKQRQQMLEQMYIRVITEMCLNRFRWVGMPDSVDTRYLEMSLFFRGLCLFYWDNDFNKYLVSRAAQVGPLNHYDNPTQYWAERGPLTTPAMKLLGPKNCVPMWGNMLRMPDQDIVMLYSWKLAMVDRSIEIAAMNARQPKVIAVPESMRQSAMNMIRQVEEGQGTIFGTEGISGLTDDLQVLDLTPPTGVLADLQVLRSKLWNECMGLLGINNANQEKKERLVADEVSANDEQVNATRNIALNARVAAASAINAMFSEEQLGEGSGLTISVAFNDNVTENHDYSEGMRI